MKSRLIKLVAVCIAVSMTSGCSSSQSCYDPSVSASAQSRSESYPGYCGSYGVDHAGTADVIDSRLREFEGYGQGNVYRLQNGQIWAQTSSRYKYRYQYGKQPLVTIYRQGGEYHMQVDGMEDTVAVERLR